MRCRRKPASVSSAAKSSSMGSLIASALRVRQRHGAVVGEPRLEIGHPLCIDERLEHASHLVADLLAAPATRMQLLEESEIGDLADVGLDALAYPRLIGRRRLEHRYEV